MGLAPLPFLNAKRPRIAGANQGHYVRGDVFFHEQTVPTLRAAGVDHVDAANG